MKLQDAPEEQNNVTFSAPSKVSVQVGQELIDEIIALCRAAKSHETGGIMYGRYTNDHVTAIVSGITSAPNDSTAGTVWFKRGVAALQMLLNNLWQRNSYYLGEWHFHPYGSPHASGQDIEQMLKIARSKNYKCPEPLLLIVGGDPTADLSIAIYLFYDGDKLLELEKSNVSESDKPS